MCLALSALACLVLACRLLRNGNELYLLLGGLIVSYGVSAAKQPYLSFGALVTLLIAGFIAFLIARPGYQPDENRLVRKYLEK
jgi:peptidoglycan/LPS O-acetylase OafA/YrhL